MPLVARAIVHMTRIRSMYVLPCSQVSLQQEEEEVEEFQLIEKLQQLGVNQGKSIFT